MGKYSNYADKVRSMAKEKFEAYQKAEAAYNKAEEMRRQYPQRNGVNTAEYAIKSAQAEAAYLEAKEALRSAQMKMHDGVNALQNMRRELEKDVSAHFTADPAALDSNTLELLKSGILKGHEYNRLLNEAQNTGNHTMARMIRKYAGDAAEKAGKEYGKDSPQYKDLISAAYNGNDSDGENEILGAWDTITEAYSRTANNPGLIGYWDQFTENAFNAL